MRTIEPAPFAKDDCEMQLQKASKWTFVVYFVAYLKYENDMLKIYKNMTEHT